MSEEWLGYCHCHGPSARSSQDGGSFPSVSTCGDDSAKERTNDGTDDDHNGSSVCTCQNCSFNATWGPTKQFYSFLAEEVPRVSSSTWRRLFRGMKSSKLPRQVDSIRAESSSNGSWRAPTRSTRQLNPRCEHFAFSCFSYLIFFLRLATAVLRLGVFAGSWNFVEMQKWISERICTPSGVSHSRVYRPLCW